MGINGLFFSWTPGSIATPYERLPLQAPFLPSRECLDNLKTINDLPLYRIEERARYEGFLEAEESLIGRLEKNWELAETLDVTHMELAAHLRLIIALGTHQKTIVYHPQLLEENSLRAINPQRLEIRFDPQVPPRGDLFHSPSGITCDMEPVPDSDQLITITNLETGATIRLDQGLLESIYHLGFYGFKENSPAQVVALIRGTLPG